MNDTVELQLDRLLEPHLRTGRSGARLLPDGLDAFAVRAVLARTAERRIDLQYYIWRSDATGRYLAYELLQAADRGVRVRLLLDDMDARSRDPILVALDRHPHIEIRLFNPFAARSGVVRTVLEVFSRGSRLNHRMHNKSWIVDGCLATLGGRNIGDEYFAASSEMNFIDMDVLLAGVAAQEAARSFEAYWNSSVAVPVSRLRRVGRNKYRLDEVRSALQESTRLAAQSAYACRVRELPQLDAMLHGNHRLDWSVGVEVVSDDPAKARPGCQAHAPGVLESLVDALQAARSQVLLISPYFVPGVGGTVALRQLAQRSVDVAVLTNSLAATDVAAVHSGYSRYRRALLESGIRLYELKPMAAPSERDRRLHLGSSRASLHTKAVILDRRRIFVGSFNVDPRSAQLNCEMGAWIDSEPMARLMLQVFEVAASADNSFALSLDERGRIRWTESADGEIVHHSHEPAASWVRRVLARLLQFLPIESQL